MFKSRKKVSESIWIIILSIWNSIIKLIKFNNPREKISKFKILSLFYIYRSYLIQNLFLASRIFESLTSISPKIGASNESLVRTPLRGTDRQKSGIWADVRTCGEEIAHALAMLQMQVQRCTCTHLGVHHRTNVSSARMHRRQVASLCKWELNGMLVGMQDSSLQGAQCIIELRTLRCNGWAWRFRDPLSLSFFTLSFYIRAFCTCSWNDDNGTGQTKVSLFYRGIWLRMSHSATLMIKPIRRLFVNREDRLIRWSEMTLEFDWFDRFLHCWIFASSKFFEERSCI